MYHKNEVPVQLQRAAFTSAIILVLSINLRIVAMIYSTTDMLFTANFVPSVNENCFWLSNVCLLITFIHHTLLIVVHLILLTVTLATLIGHFRCTTILTSRNHNKVEGWIIHVFCLEFKYIKNSLRTISFFLSLGKFKDPLTRLTSIQYSLSNYLHAFLFTLLHMKNNCTFK